MPESFENRLKRINQKAELVTKRYANLVQQHNEAKRKIEELEKQIESYRKEVQKLNTQVEYLQVASLVEQSSGDLKKSKEFLSELVWEIDKCITQLSE